MKIILLSIILHIVCISSEDLNSQDASILVMGLSGAGVFSTVEKLVKGPIQKNVSSTLSITEYKWPVLITNGEDHVVRDIRIALAPGLVNGKTIQEDTMIVENVREYINNPLGLNKGFPSIVIIVSRFNESIDDKDESNSSFVRMLKTVETLKDHFSPKNLPSNIIFHFTHIMSKGLNEAKHPKKTITRFKDIIRRNTDFPESTLITIGENRADDYNLVKVPGGHRLPNKQNYPENLIQEMKKALTKRRDFIALDVVTKVYNDTYYRRTPQINTFSTNNDEILEEQHTENHNTTNVKESHVEYADVSTINGDIQLAEDSSKENADLNSITTDLQLAYDNLHEDLKNAEILQQVIRTFKRLNITTRDELPKTTIKTVELFQNLPFHATSSALVHDAFKLRQPDFIYPPVVGQGYDMLRDETVPNSPFAIYKYEPTLMGYSLPDILVCTKLNNVNVENFRLIHSYEEYKENRLEDLGVQENINSSVFIGTVRSSYNNINPDSDAFVALTAITEIRNFKCDLNMTSSLDEQFLEDVSNLTPFNQSDRESPKEWTAFFNKYGTHVVSEAYGGGYMEGKASGESIKRNLQHSSVLDGIKNNLLSFTALPQGVNSRNIEIFHSFFGGSPDAKLAEAHKLPSSLRQDLLKQWQDSVEFDPRISELSLKLTPINAVAQLVNENVGYEVRKSLEHLFNGTLKYIRPKPVKKPPPPKQLSTTTPDNLYYTEHPIRTTTPPTINTPQSIQNSCPKPTPCPKCSESKVSSSSCSTQSISSQNVETKFADYTENIVGQGYHILTDTVLSGTPFEISEEMNVERGVSVPDGVSVIEMDTPCTYTRFDLSRKYSDYVNKRINMIYKPLLTPNPEGGLTKYLGSTRPGYNIMENLDISGPFSVYEEKRYLKVEADLTKLTLSRKFLEDARKLPSYIPNNCANHEKWLDFFMKYGTHVVTKAYAGTSGNTVYNGLSTREIDVMIKKKNPDYSSGTCTPIITEWSWSLSSKPQNADNPAVAIESVKLKTIQDVITQMGVFLLNDYDFVMTDMLDNRLKRC